MPQIFSDALHMLLFVPKQHEQEVSMIEREYMTQLIAQGTVVSSKTIQINIIIMMKILLFCFYPKTLLQFMDDMQGYFQLLDV